MIAEINIDHENKIIHRILTGEMNAPQAISLVGEIALAVKYHQGYSILVDMRDTTHHPEMGDLLAIAAECARQLGDFDSRIAFLIPDTEQRRHVAKLFRTCMETQSFELQQFFAYEPAVTWLKDTP